MRLGIRFLRQSRIIMTTKKTATQPKRRPAAKPQLVLAMPISIRPTLTDKGFVIEDADGVEHFFYNKPRSKKLLYDGFCVTTVKK